MNPRFVTAARPQTGQEVVITALLVCHAAVVGILAGVIASSASLFPDTELNAWQAVGVLAVLIILLPIAVWIVNKPEHGTLLLAAIVYANLSDIAVRSFSLP